MDKQKKISITLDKSAWISVIVSLEMALEGMSDTDLQIKYTNIKDAIFDTLTSQKD